jgi:hypothetical protein
VPARKHATGQEAHQGTRTRAAAQGAALAETAALLVLSKKVAAIFNKGEAE